MSSSAQTLTEPCRSAMRKAALRLLPLLAIGYGVAYIDRVNISYAELRMDHALGFSPAVYGLGAGLFSIAYAICQVPANMQLLRFGPRRWLSSIMLVWGLVSMATLLVKTPAEFYAARLLLGVAEAGFFPGVIFYLSQWFPAEMRSRAVSWFYVSMPLSYTFMGPAAGWLVRLNGRLGLMGWQWLLLVEALPAVLLSVLYFSILPDTPACARFLGAAECAALQEELERENGKRRVAISQEAIVRAFSDVRVWLLGGFVMVQFLSLYAFVFTAPTLIQQVTGLSLADTGLTLAMIGILGALAMVGNAWHSDKHHEWFRHIVLPMMLMMVGSGIAGISRSPVVVVSMLALFFAAACAVGAPVWSLPTKFIKGDAAAPGIAAVNTLGFVGGFVGPYWMGLMKAHTGTYQAGLRWLPVPMVLGLCLIAGVHRLLRKIEAPQDAPETTRA